MPGRRPSAPHPRSPAAPRPLAPPPAIAGPVARRNERDADRHPDLAARQRQVDDGGVEQRPGLVEARFARRAAERRDARRAGRQHRVEPGDRSLEPHPRRRRPVMGLAQPRIGISGQRIDPQVEIGVQQVRPRPREAEEGGGALAEQDGAVIVVEVFELGQLRDVDRDNARPRQRGGDTLERRLSVRRHLVPPRRAEHTDAQGAGPQRFRLGEAEDLADAVAQVEVAGVPAHGVEAVGVEFHTLAADEAPGRLEAVDAAEAGGPDGRAARLRRQRQRHMPVRHRRRRSCRGPARRAREVMRIGAGRIAPRRRELGRVGLAQDHSARRAQRRHAGGILGGDMARVERRIVRQRHSRHGDHVLHSDADAIERAAAIEPARRRQRARVVDVEPRPHLRIAPADTLQCGMDIGDGGRVGDPGHETATPQRTRGFPGPTTAKRVRANAVL